MLSMFWGQPAHKRVRNVVMAEIVVTRIVALPLNAFSRCDGARDS
jgi:hypothetical protein